MKENFIDNIRIELLDHSAEFPWALLLDADPSREAVDEYIYSSEIVVAGFENIIVGVYVLSLIENASAEIKNIAVQAAYRGRGVGRLLLNHAIENAREKRIKNLFIATADSSVQQLRFYQSVGFSVNEVVSNFFPENYPEPVIENGVQAIDKIILVMELNS